MAYEGLKVQLHAFTLALDGGEWSAPRSNQIYPRGKSIRYPMNTGLGRDDLDYMKKEKFLPLP
jgi:hypothetical protein